MDALQEAKYALRDARILAQRRAEAVGDIVPGDPVLTTYQSLFYSIAAALIAQAEAARPQFVQVGPHTISPNSVTLIYQHADGSLDIGTHSTSTTLEPDAARAFLRWWNEHADVVRLDAPDA